MFRQSGTPVGILLAVLSIALSFSTRSSESPDSLNSKQPTTEQFPEVIVTAPRRPTNLQDTPIAMTVFTGDDLQSSTIHDVPELALRTPGLVIGNNRNTSIPEIFIRGVGTVDFGVGSDLSVGFYVDDVYIGRPGAMFFDLYDTERIEILRGPQGTLYGRNTLGGAINIITNKPTDKFESVQNLRLGNFDLIAVNGRLSGPIVRDEVLGKLSYSYIDRAGYNRNVYDGRRLADAESYSGRSSLWLTPKGDISMLLTVDHTQDRPTAMVFKPVQTGMPVLSWPGAPTVADPPFNHVEPADTFKVNHDNPGSEDRKLFGISSNLTWATGSAILNSISAYRTFDIAVDEDSDGLSIQLGDFVQDERQQQVSQEFRIRNDDDSQLKWLLGAFLFSEQSDDRHSILSQDFDRILGPGIYATTNTSEVESQSYALYGETTYELTNSWSATAGVRYTYEAKEAESARVVNSFAAFGQQDFETVDKDHWEAVTPKLGLQCELSDISLIFGTVSRGFKSGGFNSFADRIEEPFDPEFITAYEAGVKSEWFERRLRLNATAFYYDHTDLQLLSVTAGAAAVQIKTRNVSEAKEMGLELEASMRPTQGFDIAGSIALLDTEYTEFVTDNNVDVSGNAVKRAPELTSNLVAQYATRVTPYWGLVLRGEHQYQTSMFFTETNESILSQRAFHALSARVAIESVDDHFAIALFGKNLTDEEIINVAIDIRDFTGTVNRSYLPPRTFGIELTYRY